MRPYLTHTCIFGMAISVDIGCFQLACIKKINFHFKCQRCVRTTKKYIKKWAKPTREGNKTPFIHNSQVGCR